MADNLKLFDLLAAGGKITADEAEKYKGEVQSTGQSPEDFIIGKKIVDEREVYRLKSQILGVPVKFFEEEEVVSDDVLREVSEDAANNYLFMPFRKTENFLEIGMLNPDDLKARDALRFILLRKGLEPRIYLITRSDYNRLMKQYRTLKGEVAEAVVKLKKEFEEIPTGKEAEEMEKRGEIAEEAPVTKILAVILKHAVEGRASDIHVEPMEDKVRVRFRVDGVLHTSLTVPKEVHAALISHIKILSNLKIDESRVPQDGRFRAKVGGKYIDLRVSTFPTSEGEKVAMRILDTQSGIKYLTDLGLEGRYADTVERALDRPFGMILITGPTGSGKSTTLYAMLNMVNKDDINIVSLEDPIEYYIDNVNQSQVRPEIKYDFASGLRSILRQDPDIIMVGEIRDAETAGLAVHAALTGHIVLSTLHTNDALGVIPRLIDMKVESYLLPSALTLAIAQRLVRRLCPDCKKPTKPNDEVMAMIKSAFEEVGAEELKLRNIDPNKEVVIYEPQGCPKCLHKGTRGRLAIFEMIEMTPEIEEVILHGLSEVNLSAEAKRQKMISMKNDGILKVVEGHVSIGDVVKVVEIS